LHTSVWKKLDPQAIVTTAPSNKGTVRLARKIENREDGIRVLVTGSLYIVSRTPKYLRPSSCINN
jgi:vancomycin permeability regulator SanA